MDQPKNAKTILVAEDEEFNFQFIQELLMDMNFVLIHAKDGNECVQICKSNPDVNLILMDIKMPIMDGLTAAILIKEFRPQLSIVAQTAYALENERVRYRGIAFDDYLSKPLTEEILKQKVLEYLK